MKWIQTLLKADSLLLKVCLKITVFLVRFGGNISVGVIILCSVLLVNKNILKFKKRATQIFLKAKAKINQPQSKKHTTKNNPRVLECYESWQRVSRLWLAILLLSGLPTVGLCSLICKMWLARWVVTLKLVICKHIFLLFVV